MSQAKSSFEKLPSDFDLPISHEKFRKYQLESILWCIDVEGTAMVEAPVGSCKTSLAAATSTRKSVVALVRHKMLQKNNYDGIYGFDAHYGRRNYRCVHPDAPPGMMCDECLYLEEGMHKCKYSPQCLYLLSKACTLSSPRASLNYSYWLTTANWRAHHAPQVLFLDEAHNIPSIITDFVGTTVTQKDQVEWNLPDFPTVDGLGSSALFQRERGDPVVEAEGWLVDACVALRTEYRKLRRSAKAGNRKARKRLVECERIGCRLRSTLDTLRANASDWYVRSGADALRFGAVRRSGFVCKPLTARHHFANYFLDGYNTIMMSATIGDFATFARELGITEYSSKVVPSRFPPEDRQVLALDVPPMGRASITKHPEYLDYHADVVADLCKKHNTLTLIHTTSKAKAAALTRRLGYRLGNRVWKTPEESTNKQFASFQKRKQQISNTVAISWSFGEGIDVGDVGLNIVAQIPYGYLGDEFVKARMKYNSDMYRLRAAWGVEQRAGRNRRGEPEHYGSDGNVVAIADGNWSRLEEYYSQSFLDSIVEI